MQTHVGNNMEDDRPKSNSTAEERTAPQGDKAGLKTLGAARFAGWDAGGD
jgi:hypothetical protein